jgi:hypothetical protein
LQILNGVWLAWFGSKNLSKSKMKIKKGIWGLVFVLGTMAASAQDSVDSTAECNCCSQAHRAFDFWAGTWEVRTADGTLAGRNRIEKLQSGCVLQEFWEGSSGSTGTSLNFYNAATGQWEQLWIDNTGTPLKLEGNRIGDQMVMSSDPFEDSQGRERVHRISWTALPDGRVRQLWELLGSGEVVGVLFDGFYTKIN